MEQSFFQNPIWSFPSDHNTVFPAFSHSTSVQILVCKEAKLRPSRANYVCSWDRSPEWIQTGKDTDIDVGIDVGTDLAINISNILTDIYTKETVWAIFLSCKRKV